MLPVCRTSVVGTTTSASETSFTPSTTSARITFSRVRVPAGPSTTTSDRPGVDPPVTDTPDVTTTSVSLEVRVICSAGTLPSTTPLASSASTFRRTVSSVPRSSRAAGVTRSDVAVERSAATGPPVSTGFWTSSPAGSGAPQAATHEIKRANKTRIKQLHAREEPRDTNKPRREATTGRPIPE